MHIRLGIALMGWLAALVSIPAVAPAASVFTREMDIFEPGQRWIVYEAAAGEANQVVVEDRDDEFTEARFVDAGAPLTVLPDCVAREGPVALCPNGPAQIELGDRDDTALITALLPPGLRLTAGDGDDEIFADTTLQPNVSGGGGNDRIRLGNSVFPGTASGGSGRDVIQGGPLGRSLSGGPGDDLILHQSLAADGVGGDEGNDLLRLHYVAPSDDASFASGGPNDDVLFVARADVPVGPDPADPAESYVRSWVLAGDDGRDVLIGGASRDALLGGSGNDVLIARDDHSDLVACGDGFDIAYVDAQDAFSNCEITLSLPLTRVARLRDALDRLSNARTASPSLSARARSALRQFVRGSR